MFQHTVEYFDFNGAKRTEALHFHISTPEMMDLQYNPMVDGDLDKFITEGIQSGDGRKLWTIFKLLIVNSYGRRSADGSRFVKNPEFTEEFLNSPAYEKFFEWVLLDSPDGKHGTEFYNGIMSERLKADAAKLTKGGEKDNRPSLDQLSQEDLLRLLEEVKSGKKPKVIES